MFQVLVCRSHSKRGNEAEIKRKKPRGPADTERPQQRQSERRRFDVASPVGVHPLFLPSLFLPHSLPLPCTTPTPPVLPSQQLSADCLGFLVPIRPIALCLRQTQHLSYHCLDNCLLVQKSLQALCSHDDDMVTLPGGSEPPAEIVYPFSSPPLTLRFPLPPSLPIPLPPFCSSFGGGPPIPGAYNSLRVRVHECANMHVYARQMGNSPAYESICQSPCHQRGENRGSTNTPGEDVYIVFSMFCISVQVVCDLIIGRVWGL